MNSIITGSPSNSDLITYNKLKEIGHSLYRYNQLSNAGLKEEANTESTRANNLININNGSEKNSKRIG